MNHPFIAALVATARPHILERFRPNSCIASTRVAIEALARFGVAATAVAAQVEIYNPTARALLEGGISKEAFRARLAESVRAAPGPEPPWSIGLGVGEPLHGSWTGHLVALTDATDASERVLIDLSLDQASRPLRDIRLSPIWVPAADEVCAGDARVGGTVAGTLVRYQLMPAQEGWDFSPDWCEPARWQDLVDATEASMREWLAAHEAEVPAPRPR